MIVFEVNFVGKNADCEYVLGIFSSREKAEKAIENAIEKDIATKDTFSIVDYELDKIED